MRIRRFAKVLAAFLAGVMLAQLLYACSPRSQAAEKTKLTIATVKNGDMVVMQGLSRKFEQANPDIQLRWVVLEENVLRQRTTTDVASLGGQFDVMTIGSYETPIWARRDWLKPLDLGANYDVNDLLKPIREGLSNNGKLYAVPFYGESSMLYYRKDLFEKAGIAVPQQPTYPQMREWAVCSNHQRFRFRGYRLVCQRSLTCHHYYCVLGMAALCFADFIDCNSVTRSRPVRSCADGWRKCDRTHPHLRLAESTAISPGSDFWCGEMSEGRHSYSFA